MNPHAFVLSLILAFTLFQTPDTHSPSTQKSCTPGVSFWKLLDEVRVGYTDGRLALGLLNRAAQTIHTIRMAVASCLHS
jgi:hypothetical protein